MRTTVKKLRRVVRRIIIEDAGKATPQADEDDIFGQYAFAGQRSDVPQEKDTPAEYQFFKQLDSHFNDNHPLNAKSNMVAKNILSREIYKGVFNEPDPSQVLCRGFSVDEDWIRQHAGFGKDEKVPDQGSNIGKTVVKSHKGDEHGSSWSTSENIAHSFSTPTTGRPYGVMCYARASDNPYGFMMGEDGLYKVKQYSVFKGEHEAVALGPITIFKFEWTSTPPDIDATADGIGYDVKF